MPVYAYRCAEHGAFDRWRPAGEAGRAAPCPHCGEPARRVWMVAPAIVRPTGWDRSPEDPAYWRDLA